MFLIDKKKANEKTKTNNEYMLQVQVLLVAPKLDISYSSVP